MTLFDFKEFGYDIGTNFVASIIFVICQFLVIFGIFLYHYCRLRRLSKIRTCVTKRKKPLIFDSFYANSGKYDEDEKAFYSYPCEHFAIGKMEGYLRKCWKHTTIYSNIGPMKVDDANRIPTENHLLLVGGPFHNLMTGYIFGMVKEYSNVPFYFGPSVIGKDKKGKPIYEDATLFFKSSDGGEPKKYVPSKDGAGQYTKDYGIIINIKNPYNRKKRLIALLGCRTFGVLGAATFFTEHSKTLEHSFKFWRIPKEYGLIVETHNDGQHLENHFEVVERFKLDPIFKDNLKKDYLKDLKLTKIGKRKK